MRTKDRTDLYPLSTICVLGHFDDAVLTRLASVLAPESLPPA